MNLLSRPICRLSQGAVAGIGVGSAAGAVGMLVAIFFLCRRRKHAKRMSSYRENLRDEYNEKDQPVDYHSAAARGTGDVFAPFGGRATSFKSPKPAQTATPLVSQSLDNRRDEISPISSSPSPIRNSFVSPITPQFNSSIREEEPSGNRNAIRSSTPGEPAQSESNRQYYELDSAGTARSNQFELPASVPASTISQAPNGVCHDAASDNSEALMPGSFPDVVKNAQRQKFTRVQSGVAAVVSVGPKNQHSRPGSFDNPSHLRATMNATADDVKQNRHVNSWTHL
ncbi:hypothetical protein KJ359_005732 [Pestalotiopsis sp. 9143b]|nr:hypothetical protein KJ359_005732 [Pestalotiopsis sp. 9143b]